MNRAEKRRQEKRARKAAKGAPGQPSQQVQERLAQALQHHSKGDLPAAEQIYRQVLQEDPRQPVALHLLGMVAHQVGRHDVAVDLIGKAVTVLPKFAVAHGNLGNALKALGRTEEAFASYRTALKLEPSLVEVHNSLGNALREQGNLTEAAASYRQALTINPNLAEVHNNLGNVFMQQGKADAAVASYQKAIALQPGYAEAHNNLGNAWLAGGDTVAAIGSYRTAVSHQPAYAEAHNNLGIALTQQNDLEAAFECHRQAVALAPDHRPYATALSRALAPLSFQAVDDSLIHDLQVVMQSAWINPAPLARPVLSALMCDPLFAGDMHQLGGETGEMVGASDAVIRRLPPLFLLLISQTVIDEVRIERALTRMRRELLQGIAAEPCDDPEHPALPFAAALALHCFTNEYVYLETEPETGVVERAEQQIAGQIATGAEISPLPLAILACYRALYDYPWARELTTRPWGGSLQAVIRRQIEEPLAERAMQGQIPALTPISGDISVAVRDQYEENPYPRWLKVELPVAGQPIDRVLRSPPLAFDLGEDIAPENPEILIAGCGTGRHAIQTACRFSGARMLAVDLSLGSLSYAMRKTGELGLAHIDYAQADIMELDRLDRQFDLIESSGVLHHLEDPVAGWKVLVEHLKPRGLMKVALYSEQARQHVLAGRRLIASEGYVPIAADIRRCRQKIMERAAAGDEDMAKTIASRDFFSLSECRDLLFHVQEHRFTLPRIEQALASLNLQFLGFEIEDRSIVQQFTTAYPEPQARTSLPLWHDFEQQYPDTFAGMYQIWCRKQ